MPMLARSGSSKKVTIGRLEWTRGKDCNDLLERTRGMMGGGNDTPVAHDDDDEEEILFVLKERRCVRCVGLGNEVLRKSSAVGNVGCLLREISGTNPICPRGYPGPVVYYY